MAKSNKFRNFMYEQQVSYLPNNMTPDEFYDYVVKKLKPKKIAFILHDKDLSADGKTLAEPHVHLMLQFENARSVNQVAKDIGDNPQQLQIWRGSVENGFSYLIHATDKSRHKHQYSCEEVKANFDYSSFIAEISNKVAKTSSGNSSKKISMILDLVADGNLSYADAKNQLSGSEYAKAGDKLKKAHELYLERSAEKLHEQMIENNELTQCHWFFGESECGKTFLAESLAKEMGLSYFKSSAERDIFQTYNSEKILILDDLRPDVIPYSELLALLNPFSRGKAEVSSRYYNKVLSYTTIFITSPYNPMAFYHGYTLMSVDKGEQLYRRLSSVLRFDMDWIYKWEYDYSFHEYTEVDKKPNFYSRKHQDPYVLENVFDRINQTGDKGEIKNG